MSPALEPRPAKRRVRIHLSQLPPRPRSVITILAIVLFAMPTLAATPGGGFLENLGQLDESVIFSTSTSGMVIYFTDDGLVLDVMDTTVIEPPAPVDDELAAGPRGFSRSPSPRRGCVVRIGFDGARAAPVVTAREQLPSVFHFFRGADRAAWRTGAHLFSEVTYQEIWPGLDLVFRITPTELRYEAIVRPEADPARIRFEYVGADRVGLEPGNVHRIETPVGELIHRLAVPGEGSGSILRDGAEAPQPLSPNEFVTEWCTLLGGAELEYGWGITCDAQDRPIVVGATTSTDFPTTSGVYDSSAAGGWDAFIARFDATGSNLEWATYLGGSFADMGGTAELDASGNIVTTGITDSNDFPTTPGAFDETPSTPLNDRDIYVSKLSANGDSLLWSTYLGKGKEDMAWSATLDAQDNVVLTGHTYSPGFPTTPGAYRRDHPGQPLRDAFVSKISADGSSLIWSTLLGADDDDEWAFSVALDSDGNPVIGGAAFSASFPTTPGAYDETYNGEPDDGYLTKLSADGSSLIWSTFVGGMIGDLVAGVGIDRGSGDVLAAARTYSPNFPTTPFAFDETHNGGMDAVVLRLSEDGTTLVWSTFVGGSVQDAVDDLAVGPVGCPVIVGSTNSSDYPTTPNALDPTHNAGTDAFITLVTNDGSDLLYSTFSGGSGTEGFAGDLTEPVWIENEKIFVTGHTMSADFPSFPETVWDRTLGGTQDAVVLVMTLPTAVDAPALPISRTDLLELAVSPNPFARTTGIRFKLPAPAPVRVTVYDSAGRLVRVLVDVERAPAGLHRFSWDGRNASGSPVAAGVYFCRVKTPDHDASQRSVLLR